MYMAAALTKNRKCRHSLHIQKIKKAPELRACLFFINHMFKKIKKPATSYFPRQLPTKYHRR